ncbi:hypothetical protein MLD38_020887 [Melastoma candidum]|uniref:Uncharacterized protein n=1 Tax=Melastoma candidum TaxID=119954 RepID=A0ACB9QHR6_9MYRT|nr:hypothetical protein MLD38_020887 [Melastoma candidum]
MRELQWLGDKETRPSPRVNVSPYRERLFCHDLIHHPRRPLTPRKPRRDVPNVAGLYSVLWAKGKENYSENRPDSKFDTEKPLLS